MSSVTLQNTVRVARVIVTVIVVWLAVPVASLWTQPWILWLALWFLSTRLRFWVQVAMILILGLQFDVMQNLPLGIGVLLGAVITCILSWLAARQTGTRFLGMMAGGVVMCLMWSQVISPLSAWSLGLQLVGIFVIGALEVWGERRG